MWDLVWKTVRPFLKPGWIITITAIVLFVYLAFSVLAPWQLGKNARQHQRNDQIVHALEVAPVDVDTLLDTSTTPPAVNPDTEWRQVTATGHFLPDAEVLLRLRPVNSEPSYQALTPFETTSGQVIVVNRGYVRPPDTSTVPPIAPAPPGELTVVGYLRVDENTPDRDPIRANGAVQVQGISSAQIGQLTNLPLVRGYIQVTADSPGTLTALPLPQLDSGPYLSYGIQWIAFGILAPVGLAYFIFAEVRERRREDAERQALSSGVTTPRSSSAADSTTPERSSDTDAHAEARICTDNTVSASDHPQTPHPSAETVTEPTPRPKRARYEGRRDYFGRLAEKEQDRF